jgi:LPS biosynthesis protein
LQTEIYYSPEELQKIQRTEKQALVVLLELCEKLKLNPFLIGGSALGAVRHQGFIPWDDDIDVGLLRRDYEIFMRQAEKLLPAGYTLQTPENGAKNPYCYVKLRVDGTRFVEYCNHRNRVMHQGVYIDVFPFDEVPDDEQENLRQFQKAQKLCRLYTVRQSADVSRPPQSTKEKAIAALRRVCHWLVRAFVPRQVLLNRLNRSFTAWNGTGQQALACLNFPKRKCEYVRREDLYPFETAVFEGLRVSIPRNYDAYLTTHYGDYRKLPPPEEQLGHRPYEVEI